jgi:hypothetical protein
MLYNNKTDQEIQELQKAEILPLTTVITLYGLNREQLEALKRIFPNNKIIEKWIQSI